MKHPTKLSESRTFAQKHFLTSEKEMDESYWKLSQCSMIANFVIKFFSAFAFSRKLREATLFHMEQMAKMNAKSATSTRSTRIIGRKVNRSMSLTGF